MRKLTAKQKKQLDILFIAGCHSVDDVPLESLRLMEQENDSEILYQEIERYLSDKYLNEIYS